MNDLDDNLLNQECLNEIQMVNNWFKENMFCKQGYFSICDKLTNHDKYSPLFKLSGFQLKITYYDKLSDDFVISLKQLFNKYNLKMNEEHSGCKFIFTIS